MRNRFSERLYEEAIKDPRIYVVVSDISPAGSMQNFRKDFPDRFINVGVAEQAMIGICAGLAREGAIPFAYSIGAFSLIRPYEMIRDDIAIPGLGVKIVGVGGGLAYSLLGPTHHTPEDIGLTAILPNFTTYAPADRDEVDLMFDQMLSNQEIKNPTYIRLGKAGEPLLSNNSIRDQLNFRFLARNKNSKTLILGYGLIMERAMKIQKILESKNGKKCDVMSLFKVNPINYQQLSKLFLEYENLIIIEEHYEIASLASEIILKKSKFYNHLNIINFNMNHKFYKFYGNRSKKNNSSTRTPHVFKKRDFKIN